MTSKVTDKEAYVWIWLPGQSEPVVCGNNEFGELSYLLESGSDRIGALDFQR